MSVYGGDSWGREAGQRKRRVDDLMAHDVNNSSAYYKKLCNGKYACLVCTHHPVLDSLLMLSLHVKGSRHKAADSQFKQRELLRKEEINKRIALSDSPASLSKQSSTSSGSVGVRSKPLVEWVRKAAAEVLSKETLQHCHRVQTCDINSNQLCNSNVPTPANECVSDPASTESIARWKLDLREQREKELKFIEAGWRRDRDGRWYRDENAEFDSDEEDPNVVLYQRTGSV